MNFVVRRKYKDTERTKSLIQLRIDRPSKAKNNSNIKKTGAHYFIAVTIIIAPCETDAIFGELRSSLDQNLNMNVSLIICSNATVNIQVIV